MRKCCFLDRDGVVNKEVDYLSRPEDVILLPGVADALKKLHQAGFLAVVVSNQSGIARGYYAEKDLAAVNAKINELLALEGTKIDAFYHCPHYPKITGECSCRKPAPGMLLRAAEELGIDLAQSFMVGDRLSDVNAGRNAHCRKSCLVRTGYGLEVIAKENTAGIPVADDLADAVNSFLYELDEMER